MSTKSAVWTTRDGRKLKVSEMETGHIRNCIEMLKRKGYISPSTLAFYLSTPGPQGDMAQMAFEQELDQVIGAPVHPILDALEAELEHRQKGAKKAEDSGTSKEAQAYIDKGYRRVSNKYRMVSRVDRPDWKEHMAIMHSPWSLEEGLAWVKCLGKDAAGHYRRCYSKDLIEDLPDSVFKRIPSSDWDEVGYVEVSK